MRNIYVLLIFMTTLYSVKISAGEKETPFLNKEVFESLKMINEDTEQEWTYAGDFGKSVPYLSNCRVHKFSAIPPQPHYIKKVDFFAARPDKIKVSIWVTGYDETLSKQIADSKLGDKNHKGSPNTIYTSDCSNKSKDFLNIFHKYIPQSAMEKLLNEINKFKEVKEGDINPSKKFLY